MKQLGLFGLTTRRVGLFVGLTLATAALEGFGMASLLPVLEYAERGQNVAELAKTSRMWQVLVAAYDAIGIEIDLLVLVVSAVGVMLLRVIFVYARQVYTAWLAQEMQHSVRSTLFEAYMAMDIGSFSRLSSGGLINTLTTEAQRATGSLAALFALGANIAVCSGFALVLLWLSTPLTLLALAFLGVSAAAVSIYVRHTRSQSHAATEASDRYSRMVLERLTAFRLVKLTSTVGRESSKVRTASENVCRLLYLLARGIASVDLIMEPMVLISGGAILYLAIEVFGMSLSEVGIFVLIMLRLLPLAKEAMKSRQTYNSCAGSVQAVVGGYNRAMSGLEPNPSGRPFDPLVAAIRFGQVTYKYPGSARPALQEIELDIPARQVTALVGPSGSGKTTLVDLIPRLRIPDHGIIRFDGIDASEFELNSLRRGIAFVSQDALVLDDTVAGNLRFINPEATDEQIWEALSKAQAASFVDSLPAKLETHLGERGTTLSGGQRQRLSLARALLQEASILILDEPTSALDYETEAGVQRAITELRAQGSKTVVIIAHRLSTIRNADKIIVLREGRVTEQGRHDELATNEDWYARVAGLQAAAS